MTILVFDFETSGLPLFSEPSGDPRQPHLVQVGAVLACEKTRKVEASLDLIVRPHGWEIPPETAEIHGITTEKALAFGVPEEAALTIFLDMWRAADYRVAHNESFDARIARIAIKRLLGLDDLADEWKAADGRCTANMATKIMKMPATAKMVASGRRHSKKPKLTEAYQHFTGKVLEDAHSAMADTLACMEVYWALLDHEGHAAKAAPAAEKPAPIRPTPTDDEVPFL